jgi:DNA-binding transcriptional regulator of glucitol operon
VRRVLLSPKWLVGHVLAVAVALTCLALGWWQWDRWHSVGGTMQNLGYALQWPMFAIFALVAWGRIVYLELHPPPARSPRPPAGRSASRPAAAPHPGTAGQPAAGEDVDEELAAYNRYLAQLHARDEERPR